MALEDKVFFTPRGLYSQAAIDRNGGKALPTSSKTPLATRSRAPQGRPSLSDYPDEGQSGFLLVDKRKEIQFLLPTLHRGDDRQGQERTVQRVASRSLSSEVRLKTLYWCIV